MNEERVQRGMKNTFDFYEQYDYPVIDTTVLEPGEMVEKAMQIANLVLTFT